MAAEAGETAASRGQLSLLQPPGLAVAVATVAVAAAFAIYFFGLGRSKERALSASDSEVEEEEEASSKNGEVKKAEGGGSKKQKWQQRREKTQQSTFSHPLLAATLKAHSSNVTSLDFSNNGKYVATCSDDRTVRIWQSKDFGDRDHKSSRANVDLDHATLVRFSPDSRAFIVWLASAETIRVYKMSKKDDGTFAFSVAPNDFPRKHKAEIINIGIAATGKFVMTASADTTIHLWDLKGEILATINTNQMTNAYAAISPCGRFIGSCGFTPDVKVWEVCFAKTGGFREVSRAFELKGHSAAVHSFGFSNDSHRMATVSKDGTWRLWDTNIQYRLQQEPYLLTKGKYEAATMAACRLALSPDGRVLALAAGPTVHVFDARTARLMETIVSPHGPEAVLELTFDPLGRYVASCGDRAVRVVHNAAGFAAQAEELEEQARVAPTEAVRDRLRQQAQKARQALRQITAVA